MGIPCIFLAMTDTAGRFLRRYGTDAARCTLNPDHLPDGDYHRARVLMDTVPGRWDAAGNRYAMPASGDLWPHDDPRWPATCDCGYRFQDGDAWQVHVLPLYQRSDTGELLDWRDAPVGSMWYAPHLDRDTHPQLVHALIVRTPGGDICLDAQGGNCTIPDDRRQERHHCWVLHGAPPVVTACLSAVTCAAGAGSILIGGWHGFLTHGVLEG